MAHEVTIARVHQAFVESLVDVPFQDLQKSFLEKKLAIFIHEKQFSHVLALPEHQVVRLVLERMYGLGVLEPLMADGSISEIMVNGHDDVWIERAGSLERSSVYFDSNEEVLQLVNRLVSAVGRRFDEEMPFVDARLPDGSRLHAIMPPLSRRGPVVTIRRFPKDVLHLSQAVAQGTLSKIMADFLSAAVEAKQSILISGATGSGKTSLLNALAARIPQTERIITIEDTAELRLHHPHVIGLEARTANVEGRGEITIRSLVKNALRMRPDRIIVGEVRGAESFDMLQALNTGHRGSLTTVHANSAVDALKRLTATALLADSGLPYDALQEHVAEAIGFVVQLRRFSDGVRRIVSVDEVLPAERGTHHTQTIFAYDQRIAQFTATGAVPRFAALFEKENSMFNRSWFTKL